jgi:hypothetical protein
VRVVISIFKDEASEAAETTRSGEGGEDFGEFEG